MATQIVDVVSVINIVHFCFELLTLLKVVLNIEALDPGWIKIVHDDLCESELLPRVANLLVEDDEAISARERI